MLCGIPKPKKDYNETRMSLQEFYGPNFLEKAGLPPVPAVAYPREVSRPTGAALATLLAPAPPGSWGLALLGGVKGALPAPEEPGPRGVAAARGGAWSPGLAGEGVAAGLKCV